MTIVRCYFEPTGDPADLGFLRIPQIGETVMYDDKEWRVRMVTWTSFNAYITLSLVL